MTSLTWNFLTTFIPAIAEALEALIFGAEEVELVILDSLNARSTTRSSNSEVRSPHERRSLSLTVCGYAFSSIVADDDFSGARCS